MNYVILIEPAGDGSLSAWVPDLPGCTSCGDTESELRANIREAIREHVRAMREAGEAIPAPSSRAEVVEAAA